MANGANDMVYVAIPHSEYKKKKRRAFAAGAVTGMGAAAGAYYLARKIREKKMKDNER